MNHILVATDFSARSDRALRRAVLIAQRSGAALTLLHVVDDDQPAYLVERQKLAAAEVLEKTARTIAESDRLAVETMVATGDAFAAILEAVEQARADLVVVGRHRRQFLDTFVGTTAERTIRRSRHPVLMVNATPAAPYERSLIAVDFDDASRAAIAAAQGSGILDGTEQIALHLFEAPAVGMMKRAMEVPEAIDHYVGGEERRVGAKLREFLAETGLRYSKQLIRPQQSSPAGGILLCAEDQGADLIVVGTNQRKGVKRFLLGSVAQEVLLDAERDVLVVPVGRDVAEPSAR